MSALQDLIDEARELEIAWAGKNIEVAQKLLEQPGADHFHCSGQRDHWKLVMSNCINARSPAQIARLEKERGLDHA